MSELNPSEMLYVYESAMLYLKYTAEERDTGLVAYLDGQLTYLDDDILRNSVSETIKNHELIKYLREGNREAVHYLETPEFCRNFVKAIPRFDLELFDTIMFKLGIKVTQSEPQLLGLLPRNFLKDKLGNYAEEALIQCLIAPFDITGKQQLMNLYHNMKHHELEVHVGRTMTQLKKYFEGAEEVLDALKIDYSGDTHLFISNYLVNKQISIKEMLNLRNTSQEHVMYNLLEILHCYKKELVNYTVVNKEENNTASGISTDPLA